MTTSTVTHAVSSALDKIEGTVININASPLLYTKEFKARAQRELSELVIDNLPEMIELARTGLAYKRNKSAKKIQVPSLNLDVLKTSEEQH